MTLTATSEQADAVDVFREELNQAIEAFAGAGKTSTLRMMAAATSRRGAYLAFNRSVVEDAKASFARNVRPSTVHGLAFRNVGRLFERRLNQPRMRSYDIAKLLGITRPLTIDMGGGERKLLQPGYLASAVVNAMKTFAFSADPEPAAEHVQFIEGLDPIIDGRRSRAHNDYVAEQLVPYMRKMWADWQNPDGQAPYTHDAYVKAWSTREPTIDGDFLLLDEAQDLSPVQIQIAEAQRGRMQLVIIGDEFQHIYGWRGAVNAMQLVDVEARSRLSMSFRFGANLAAVADRILHWLPQMPDDVHLTGRPGGEGRVIATGPAWAEPDAILCRTNAVAIRNVLILQAQGRKPHLVGGGKEIEAFARACRDLKEFGHTEFHELACFDSWLAVQAYCEDDPSGSDLALMVRLVDQFGVDAILECVRTMPPEPVADVIVSTAHKAKGREWDAVQLADDFAFDPTEQFPDDAEIRLLYVAVTRAKNLLDLTQCGILPHLVQP